MPSSFSDSCASYQVVGLILHLLFPLSGTWSSRRRVLFPVRTWNMVASRSRVLIPKWRFVWDDFISESCDQMSFKRWPADNFHCFVLETDGTDESKRQRGERGRHRRDEPDANRCHRWRNGSEVQTLTWWTFKVSGFLFDWGEQRKPVILWGSTGWAVLHV